MKSKRILFFSSVKNKNLFNIQRFYRTDIDILNQLGYEVIVSNRISDAWFFWKYDLVFAYFYKYSFFVSLIAKIFGKDTYFTGGIDSLDRKLVPEKEYKTQKIFFRLCYNISKSCIIVSKTDYANVMSIVGGKKLSFSEHTICTAHFDCKIENKENLITTIVWQGTKGNVQRKGVDTALRVFAGLKNTHLFQDYRFVIIGARGNGTAYLQGIIDELGIKESVRFTDSISEEEKIDYLKRSKLYFQLSKFEGFGVAALEALCSKNIVIHSGKGGLSNPIYNNGILVDIDSPIKSIVDKLRSDLSVFNNERLEVAHRDVCRGYDDDRRKKDFSKIIGNINY